MFKNKAEDGLNNICGPKIKQFRKQVNRKLSQRQFAELLQIAGVDLEKNAIQQMESGKRFITDIELRTIAKVLHVTYADLLDEEKEV